MKKRRSILQIILKPGYTNKTIADDKNNVNSNIKAKGEKHGYN